MIKKTIMANGQDQCPDGESATSKIRKCIAEQIRCFEVYVHIMKDIYQRSVFSLNKAGNYERSVSRGTLCTNPELGFVQFVEGKNDARES